MSENWRKDIGQYTVMCSPRPRMDKPGQKVFRPHSMRRVSATLELNRLLARIEKLRTGLHCISLASQNTMGGNSTDLGKMARQIVERDDENI